MSRAEPGEPLVLAAAANGLAEGGVTIVLGVAVCVLALPSVLLSLRWRRGRTPRARWWVRTIPLDEPGSRRQQSREFVALVMMPTIALVGTLAGLGLIAVAFPLPIALVLVGVLIAIMIAGYVRLRSDRHMPNLDPDIYPQWLRPEREAEYRRLEDAGLVPRRSSRPR